ncbi:sensor histidine kinase [Sphingomonas sp.]|jgi:nitrogen fixation/metabolism regulation signal transduction histidine kinase|uniref:sensor histidine kinase n=1 Tax=Sphingomonas sp. TaxID=28214 RepID=UPI002EDA574E
MGSDLRFTLILVAWIAAIIAAWFGVTLAFETAGFVAVRIIALLLAVGAVAGLWRHVSRTNVMIARFVEAQRHGDYATRFDPRGGTGFAVLGQALNDAMARLQRERTTGLEELRFLEALVDDLPVALLTVDDARGVRLANKAARRLFGHAESTRPADYAAFGGTFAARLADPERGGAELIILRLPGGPQRAILRAATLVRLGARVRAITVEPVQGTLDAVEIAAQTDLVRVLTHEILNSLTPVTSLSATAAALLEADPCDSEGAREAVRTVARRAKALHGFIASYRAVSTAPAVRLQDFRAAPFADELVRLIGSEWPGVTLAAEVAPDLMLRADPDLLGQALINLLRNAAQASATAIHPRVTLSIAGGSATTIAVRDNGPGVPEPLRRDVFLPFFTTRAEGNGIGLNLVRQIIVAHGWQIDIVDCPGGGACFRILLLD